MIILIISVIFLVVINIFMFKWIFVMFFNDIFDENIKTIYKTLIFLMKIYNNKIPTIKEARKYNINIYKTCKYNKIIKTKNSKIMLTNLGLQLCFQYMNNKYLS